MRRMLGEAPAIDITYKKDVMINEFNSEVKEIKEIDRIKIVFTGLDDKFKKIEFTL